MALFVAALDFGTTYSAWACSSKADFDSDPTKVQAKNWQGGSLMSTKVPTTVLIHPDGKTFHSFGYKAEDTYTELAIEHNHGAWYYFTRFKMLLFDNLDMGRNITIEDATGKTLSAKLVFSMAIKFLHDDVMETIRQGMTGEELTEKDVHWVITVPAIWSDVAKQFMREAAEEAGIKSERLSIALEPEAASLYCRSLPVEKATSKKETSLSSFKAGRKYMVLDAGGGTVDVTVHMVTSSGNLIELYKASGGSWGGTKVDSAFERFMTFLTGEGVIAALKQIHMEDYLDLCREFEAKKRTVFPKNESGAKTATVSKISLKIPSSLRQLTKMITNYEFEATVKHNKRYGDKLQVVSDKLRVPVEVAIDWFNRSVKSIIAHVEDLLKQETLKGCDTMLMVGGFSESPVLQQAVKSHFPKMTIIIPEEAGLVVVKGAVIYGHKPAIITKRVCKMTYGTCVAHFYDPRICRHTKSRQETNKDGQTLCLDVFKIHAKAGETVEVGKEQDEVIANPADDDQTAMCWEIYATSNTNPELVTEDGCKKIGTLTVPIKDQRLGKKHAFGASFVFGGTEIVVIITDKSTGERFTTQVNFLG